MLKYYGFLLAALIVPRLPVWLGYRIGSLAADIGFLLQRRTRENVRNNLRHVLGPGVGDAELDGLVREVFRSGAKNYYDLFRIPGLSKEQVKQYVEVRGLENVLDGFAHGKGVIIVAPHLGSFDLVAQIATAMSIKLTIPVERIQPPKLFELVTRTRAAQGVRLVAVGDASKEVYRALAHNEMVAIAADRDVMHNGVPVRFFDAETTIPGAPVALALRTGAAIVPACAVRLDEGRYAVQIEPRLELQVTGDQEKDIRVNSQRVVEAMESFIRRYPTQWVAFEPVWNGRPAGPVKGNAEERRDRYSRGSGNP